MPWMCVTDDWTLSSGNNETQNLLQIQQSVILCLLWISLQAIGLLSALVIVILLNDLSKNKLTPVVTVLTNAIHTHQHLCIIHLHLRIHTSCVCHKSNNLTIK